MKARKSLLVLFAALPFGLLATSPEQTSSNAKNDPVQPTVAKAVDPIYPDAARAAGIEGTVIVECLVAADGTILASASPDKNTDARLRDAALEAVAQWRFEPSDDLGESGYAIVRVPIHFELEAKRAVLHEARVAAR